MNPSVYHNIVMDLNLWPVYDFLARRGSNLIKERGDGLETVERAKLNAKIDLLRMNGADLSPELLSDTNIPTIKKIRVKGRVAVRLMLCRGPIHVHDEFTLLMGAVEKDRKLIPSNAEGIAEERRLVVIATQSRRTEHVRFR